MAAGGSFRFEFKMKKMKKRTRHHCCLMQRLFLQAICGDVAETVDGASNVAPSKFPQMNSSDGEAEECEDHEKPRRSGVARPDRIALQASQRSATL